MCPAERVRLPIASSYLRTLERVDERMDPDPHRVSTTRVVLAQRGKTIPLRPRCLSASDRCRRYIERHDVRSTSQITRPQRLGAPVAQRNVVATESLLHPRRYDGISVGA